MRIFTSYFARTSMLLQRGIVPISISQGSPKGVQVAASLKQLAPTWDMVMSYKGTHDKKAYTDNYQRILSRLDPQDIYDKICRISGGRDVALLCFEKPGDFCHRHLAAEWLSESLGLQIEEWRPGEP